MLENTVPPRDTSVFSLETRVATSPLLTPANIFETPRSMLADHAFNDHYGAIAGANRFAAEYWRNAKGTEQHAHTVAQLEGGITALHAQLAEISPDVISERKSKIQRGLTRAQGLEPHLQLASIAAEFTGPTIYVADCDNTMTDQTAELTDHYGDPHDFGHALHVDEVRVPTALNGGTVDPFDANIRKMNYLTRTPGSAIAEPMLDAEGRPAFVATHAGVWVPLLKEQPGLFKAASEHVKIRPGVDDFFKHATDGEQIVYKPLVLSANFKPFVDGVIEKIPHAKGVQSFAVEHDDVTATAKAEMIRLIAAANPDSMIVFIGDGSSDIPVLDDPEAQAVLGAVCALKGEALDQRAQKEPVLNFSYTDFHSLTKLAQFIAKK